MGGSAFPFPPRASADAEIAAAVDWAVANRDRLRGDGRMILSGNSSGATCAANYALSPSAPNFDAVLLFSGACYDMRTEFWTGLKKYGFTFPAHLAWWMLIGVSSAEERTTMSPIARCENLANQRLQGQHWYVVSAWLELYGLEPLAEMIFNTIPLCAAIEG